MARRRRQTNKKRDSGSLKYERDIGEKIYNTDYWKVSRLQHNIKLASERRSKDGIEVYIGRLRTLVIYRFYRMTARDELVLDEEFGEEDSPPLGKTILNKNYASVEGSVFRVKSSNDTLIDSEIVIPDEADGHPDEMLIKSVIWRFSALYNTLEHKPHWFITKRKKMTDLFVETDRDFAILRRNRWHREG